jgi:DNA-binding protein H-NS
LYYAPSTLTRREARAKKEEVTRDLSNVNEMLQQETLRADREAEAASAAKSSAPSSTARREAAEARWVCTR